MQGVGLSETNSNRCFQYLTSYKQNKQMLTTQNDENSNWKWNTDENNRRKKRNDEIVLSSFDTSVILIVIEIWRNYKKMNEIYATT